MTVQLDGFLLRGQMYIFPFHPINQTLMSAHQVQTVVPKQQHPAQIMLAHLRVHVILATAVMEHLAQVIFEMTIY